MNEKLKPEFSKKSVLIAGENPSQSEELKHILNKYNYNVIMASDGKEALALTIENKPSLVICDILLPQMNGYTLCTEIKSNITLSDIPVILISPLANTDEIFEGFACGADSFISKPFHEENIISLIQQVLANRELHKGEIKREGFEIVHKGKKRFISTNQQQMLSLLLSTFEAAIQKNNELAQTQEELKRFNQHAEAPQAARTAELSAEIEVHKSVAETLIRAKEKAEKSDRLKTAFLNNISHEVRTPMNAIIGFSEFISDPNLSPEKRTYFSDIIVQNCYQLLSKISDIISIANIETGQDKATEEEIDLNSTLRQLYENFLSKPKKKGVGLILKNISPDDEVTILTDESKLIQILSKLIDNALKFTNQGYVNFGYKIKDNVIEFFVEDTGVGIPHEMNQEIFKGFNQVKKNATNNFGGPGLGLSISKAYVELLGGKIWLKSELRKGSTFYFAIPYKKAQRITLLGKQSVDVSNFEIKTNITLLIAEDEESNFMLLKEYLTGLSIDIIWARHGLEAIEICKKQSVDLVLMDLKMPVMDGNEATMRIKDFKPNLPIIAQTAYTTDSDRNKALTCGCTDFITKPIKKDLLISKIKEQLLKSYNNSSD